MEASKGHPREKYDAMRQISRSFYEATPYTGSKPEQRSLVAKDLAKIIGRSEKFAKKYVSAFFSGGVILPQWTPQRNEKAHFLNLLVSYCKLGDDEEFLRVLRIAEPGYEIFTNTIKARKIKEADTIEEKVKPVKKKRKTITPTIVKKKIEAIEYMIEEKESRGFASSSSTMNFSNKFLKEKLF